MTRYCPRCGEPRDDHEMLEDLRAIFDPKLVQVMNDNSTINVDFKTPYEGDELENFMERHGYTLDRVNYDSPWPEYFFKK